MADGITVAPHFYEQARIAVNTSLMLIPFIKNFDGTVDEAIDHYNMREYVENAISVYAADKAYLCFTTGILNEETFKGAYAHLAEESKVTT